MFYAIHTRINGTKNSHKVSKLTLPRAVQEICNKILLLESKCVYSDQEEITGSFGRTTCESSVQF